MVGVRKILLVRTDRLGELLLTTPAVRAVRQTFAGAEISMVVRPASEAVVRASPYVDSIIAFDPRAGGGGLIRTLEFFAAVRRRNFDLAVIFNPSRYFNLLTFLAGIPVRVGYDRKWGFLLSHRVVDKKYLCEKHEIEYNLDLVGLIGARTEDKVPSFPLDNLAEAGIEELLRHNGVRIGERLVAVHPATSNPQKMWPSEGFAQISVRLIKEFGVRIVLVGGGEEARIIGEVKAKINSESSRLGDAVLDFTGALSIKELGSLLKRCLFLVSCDSGPVHIAAAVGTPVVVFFGEARAGGSSKRWGPYGVRHRVISKPKVGDITVEEAYGVVKEEMLSLCQRH